MAALLCAKRPEEFSFRKVEIGHELHSFFFFFYLRLQVFSFLLD